MGKANSGSMKDEAIKLHIEQLAKAIEEEYAKEKDIYRTCLLMDVQEYLRRAWHAVDNTPCEDNDTTIETQRMITSND